jgi:hypothetical protein
MGRTRLHKFLLMVLRPFEHNIQMVALRRVVVLEQHMEEIVSDGKVMHVVESCMRYRMRPRSSRLAQRGQAAVLAAVLHNRKRKRQLPNTQCMIRNIVPRANPELTIRVLLPISLKTHTQHMLPCSSALCCTRHRIIMHSVRCAANKCMSSQRRRVTLGGVRARECFVVVRLCMHAFDGAAGAGCSTQPRVIKEVHPKAKHP